VAIERRPARRTKVIDFRVCSPCLLLAGQSIPTAINASIETTRAFVAQLRAA